MPWRTAIVIVAIRVMKPKHALMERSASRGLCWCRAVMGMSLNFFHLGTVNSNQKIRISLSVSDTVHSCGDKDHWYRGPQECSPLHAGGAPQPQSL